MNWEFCSMSPNENDFDAIISESQRIFSKFSEMEAIQAFSGDSRTLPIHVHLHWHHKFR